VSGNDPAAPLLEQLAAVGRQIAHHREQVAAMTTRRQELIRLLREMGVPLVTCAKVAGVTPEAITLQDRRSQRSSP
jgi:hypothetical protein